MFVGRPRGPVAGLAEGDSSHNAACRHVLAEHDVEIPLAGLRAGREVQVPLRGFIKSREQAEDLSRSVTAAASATEVGVAQYRTGTIDFNRVFNLETTQVQQQDRLATAQGDIALNLIAVYRAIGGGWELRLQEPPSPPALVPAPAPAPAPPSAGPNPPAPLVPDEKPANAERNPG